jgi:hypothetical protein
MKSAIVILAAAMLSGCTSITLPDGAHVVRVGYGAVIEYQSMVQDVPGNGTIRQTAIVTRSQVDADLLRELAAEARQYARPGL